MGKFVLRFNLLDQILQTPLLKFCFDSFLEFFFPLLLFTLLLFELSFLAFKNLPLPCDPLLLELNHHWVNPIVVKAEDKVVDNNADSSQEVEWTARLNISAIACHSVLYLVHLYLYHTIRYLICRNAKFNLKSGISPLVPLVKIQ